MSFGDDIRTIARTRELQEKIDKAVKAALAANKAAIEGKRAIAYLQANGTIGVQQNGSPGDTPLEDDDDDPFEDIDDDKDDEIENPEEDSTTPDDPNGTDISNNGTEGGIRDPINNPAPGTYSANELIDGAISGAISRLPVSEGDGKGNGRPGSRKVNTIYGKDQYGNDVYTNTHGFYDAVEGWRDPNSPPQYDDWELGYYWVCSDAAYTHDPVVDNTNPVYGGASGQVLATLIPNIATFDGSLYSVNGTNLSLETVSPGVRQIVGEVRLKWKPPNEINNEGDPEGKWTPYPAGRLISKHECTITPPEGAITACSLTSPPLANQFWPIVGNYALALIGNLFTPSVYDSEVPPIYKSVTSSRVWDLGDGRYAVLRPSLGGGHIMYETTLPYADAPAVEGGTALWFRNDWTLGRFIPNNNINRWKVPSGLPAP